MSIFEKYYSTESFQDRFLIESDGAVDVIIPVVHTNELWRNNLNSIYREIPVRRLLISDGGCKDDSIEIVSEFPRVTVFDHREYVSLGYCLRKLIESVNTEWFVYLHSDVYLPSGWFDAMQRHQDNYDWFGCPQRITCMVEYNHVDSMSGLRRPYAGSQMGRKQAFLDGIGKIEDDYVYRQEDLVLLDVVQRHGFRHGFVEDMFHYHQVMRKESPWARKLTSVRVSVEWSREEEIRAANMQVKGIIKYLRPSLALAIEVETQLLRLIQLQEMALGDFMVWMRATNLEWVGWIKPWRIRLMSISMATKPLIRRLYFFLRGA
jgi:Glycosyl transferase family 2